MKRTMLVAGLVLALTAAACSDSDSSSQAESASDEGGENGEASCSEREVDVNGDFPVTVTSGGTEVELSEPPTCIVSLSPTATEMLFAVGADDQVVAVDDQSNFPSEAPTTDLSGFTPNVEAIAAHEPDLVVADRDSGDLVDGLGVLDIAVVLMPAASTMDDVYAQIEQTGAMTGRVDEAAAVVESMKAEIDEIVASAPEFDEAPTYYHELDENLFSVTSDTFIGSVYALLGLENIADGASGAAEAGGFPQLSSEFVIEQDPDLIFLADTKCCDQDADTIAERPGWSGLTAVQNGNVIELDDDIASRWGPRIVDFLREVAESLDALQTELDEAA